MGKSNSTRQTSSGDQPRQASQTGEAAAIPREQLIAEAAYLRAEQRGFHPGNEMADWFEAEADVDRKLGCDKDAAGGRGGMP